MSDDPKKKKLDGKRISRRTVYIRSFKYFFFDTCARRKNKKQSDHFLYLSLYSTGVSPVIFLNRSLNV
jgi:hypothetical protein